MVPFFLSFFPKKSNYFFRRYEMYRGSDSISMEVFNPYLIDDIDWNADALLDIDVNMGMGEEEDDDDGDEVAGVKKTPQEAFFHSDFGPSGKIVKVDYSKRKRVWICHPWISGEGVVF